MDIHDYINPCLKCGADMGWMDFDIQLCECCELEAREGAADTAYDLRYVCAEAK